MATRIPFSLNATLAGRKQASSFVRDGQTIAIPEKLQFLVEADDGSVQLVELSGSAFDRIQPPFNHSTIVDGGKVKLSGEAVVQDRGSERDSYFTVGSCELVDAKATPLRAAS